VTFCEFRTTQQHTLAALQPLAKSLRFRTRGRMGFNPGLVDLRIALPPKRKVCPGQEGVEGTQLRRRCPCAVEVLIS
jgi:hypothetical protein